MRSLFFQMLVPLSGDGRCLGLYDLVSAMSFCFSYWRQRVGKKSKWGSFQNLPSHPAHYLLFPHQSSVPCQALRSSGVCPLPAPHAHCSSTSSPADLLVSRGHPPDATPSGPRPIAPFACNPFPFLFSQLLPI